MAKTDWTLEDEVKPEDMNALGQEVNDNAAAAQAAQNIANSHASRHAAGGADPLTPGQIGAETPAGAQSKANAALQAAKEWATPENVTIIAGMDADVSGDEYPIGVTCMHISSQLGWPQTNGTVLNMRSTNNFRFSQVFIQSNTAGTDATYIRTWRSDSGWSTFKQLWDSNNLPNPARTDSANTFANLQAIDAPESTVLRLRRSNGSSNVAIRVENNNNDQIFFGMKSGREFSVGSTTSLSGSSVFHLNVDSGRLWRNSVEQPILRANSGHVEWDDGGTWKPIGGGMIIPLFISDSYALTTSTTSGNRSYNVYGGPTGMTFQDYLTLWTEALQAGRKVYFEAVICANGGTTHAGIGRSGDAYGLISTTSSVFTRVRSSAMTLPYGSNYWPLLWTSGGEARMKSACLVIE